MSHLAELLYEVAEQTRADFIDGRITPNEILNAADSQGLDYWITGQQSGRKILDYDGFPGDCCTIASIVLGKRVNTARILGRAAALIPGGFLLNDEYEHGRPEFNKFHAVVGVGETDLGEDTIMCITAGQFPGMPNRSYVGPLINPWNRIPGETILPIPKSELEPALVGVAS